MFEAIQYLVSQKKLEDGFCIDNIAVVNGRGKLQDYVMTLLDLIFSLSKIVLHDILNHSYRLEINQTNDFRLLIDVSRDPRAFHKIIHILIFICCFNLY